MNFIAFDDFEDLDDVLRSVKIHRTRRMDVHRNFKQLYWFEKENLDYLVREFLPPYDETRGGAVSNEQKMKSFLRYIGDPGFQVGVGEDTGLHQTTVSKMNWFVCQHICEKAAEWIKFPSTEEELKNAQMVWSTKYKFPSCIGALDCTHVVIKKPSQFVDEYVNRKNQCSFNVQATCDAAEMFTSINNRWAGSVHDSRIWRNSNIRKAMLENPVGALLLADDGYGITPWTVTPYRNPHGRVQINYNIIHARERVIIERCFGQLKQRFPILHSKIRVATERIPSFITACFVLHNCAKFIKDPDFEIEDNEQVNIPIPPNNDEVNNNTYKKRGETRREFIANHLHGLNS